MEKDKELELIILKHTKWLWVISSLMFGLLFGYLFGWFDGLITVSNAYQMNEITETLNITKEVSDYILIEVSKE